jgi:hypothetical protein
MTPQTRHRVKGIAYSMPFGSTIDGNLDLTNYHKISEGYEYTACY